MPVECREDKDCWKLILRFQAYLSVVHFCAKLLTGNLLTVKTFLIIVFNLRLFEEGKRRHDWTSINIKRVGKFMGMLQVLVMVFCVCSYMIHYIADNYTIWT